MTTPATPSEKKSPGVDRNLVVVDDTYLPLTFEDRLRSFWKNYSKAVWGVCAIVVIAILAYGAWEIYQNGKEAAIESDYALANTPEKIKAFAAANPGHSLAGVAHLRLADDAYTAGQFSDAVAGYEKASTILKDGPLAARAQIGAALANVGLGKMAEAETALRALSGNTAQLKAVRAEATYHLASLATDAGKADEVAKYSDLLMQVDPSSSWAQRAMSLRASLPVSTTPTVPAAGAGAAAGQVKLPGQP